MFGKQRRFLILPLLGMLVYLAGCTAKGNATTEFWVRGNCDMCRETIEKALNGVEGVSEASYDVDAKMATVTFDSTVSGKMDFHNAVAAAGYETRLVQASGDAYTNLPKCCKKPEDM